MKIEIKYNDKVYLIDKNKLLYVLSKLKNTKIKESEIESLMEKYKLYDEYFLKNINKL